MSIPQHRSRRPRGVKVQIEGIAAVKLGGDRFRWDDAYSALFSMRPPTFIATYVATYLSLNAFFAVLYMLQPGSVADARPGSFRDHFFFSLETFATVGYGVMSPHTLWAHVVASTEILTGVFFTAGLAGLIFSRFSRPRARLVFSDKLVVGPFRGERALMLRVASRRNRAMSDVSAKLTLLAQDDEGGQVMRRFIDLPLVRDSAPLLGLTWTLAHPIRPNSPLSQLERLLQSDANLAIIASITGYDEAIAATVSARHIYKTKDILVGHAFVDIISLSGDGGISLDLTRIHDAERLVAEGGR